MPSKGPLNDLRRVRCALPLRPAAARGGCIVPRWAIPEGGASGSRRPDFLTATSAVLPSLLYYGILDWIGSELSRDYTNLRTGVLYPPPCSVQPSRN